MAEVTVGEYTLWELPRNSVSNWDFHMNNSDDSKGPHLILQRSEYPEDKLFIAPTRREAQSLLAWCKATLGEG